MKVKLDSINRLSGFWIAGFGTLLLVSFVCGTLWLANDAHDAISQHRKPAHVMSAAQAGGHVDPVKMSRLQARSGLDQLHKFGKPRSYLHVAVRGPSKQTPRAGESFTLRGTIVVHEPMDHLEFKWSLPDGVSVISGLESDTLHDLESGASREVEITLSSNTDENRQVYLEVYQMRGGERHGNTAQYNTVLQRELDEAAKERRLEIQAKGDGEILRKLIQ